MIVRILILTLSLISVCAISLSAQTPSRDSEKGFVPGVPYASSDAENINLTNGNLAFSFPLGSLPQGRGAATAGLFLRYNSKLWKKQIEYIPEEAVEPLDRHSLPAMAMAVGITGARINSWSRHVTTVSTNRCRYVSKVAATLTSTRSIPRRCRYSFPTAASGSSGRQERASLPQFTDDTSISTHRGRY